MHVIPSFRLYNFSDTNTTKTSSQTQLSRTIWHIRRPKRFPTPPPEFQPPPRIDKLANCGSDNVTAEQKKPTPAPERDKNWRVERANRAKTPEPGYTKELQPTPFRFSSGEWESFLSYLPPPRKLSAPYCGRNPSPSPHHPFYFDPPPRVSRVWALLMGDYRESYECGGARGCGVWDAKKETMNAEDRRPLRRTIFSAREEEPVAYVRTMTVMMMMIVTGQEEQEEEEEEEEDKENQTFVQKPIGYQEAKR
ncbi:hypothetical protein Trydic_g2304 [Trypoxylus dichotomus]